MGSYAIDDDRLIAAVEDLQLQETATGHWGLGGTSLPFGEKLQDLFPVSCRFVDQEGISAISRLSPELVAMRFDVVFS
jgi:hypothetical protein